MSRIYTRSGDKGTTSLIGGERVAKDDPRVEAYGSVDELGAQVGLLADFAAEVELHLMVELLDRIGAELMTVEAELALSAESELKITRIGQSEVERLEQTIDTLSAELPPVGGFTLIGGHRIISQCHVCRTVCRRAERRVLTASRDFAVGESVRLYLNRLSDLLYVLSRWSGARLGVKEKVWLG